MIRTMLASLSRRAGTAALVLGAAGASMTFGASLVQATPPGWQREAEEDVAKLPLCYAAGTDAIGRGDLAQGKAIYATCFTADAELSVYFPGTPLDGPPSFSTTGTSSWADFVASVFTANGYVATQHMMGNIDAHVNGNQATMTSYLNATHALPDGTIAIANGTYEDEVIRQNGAWKIKRRTLKLITFINLGG